MRNILLAITSFFATVLILSQVAVAAPADDGGDPNHTVAAQGDDPNLAIAKSSVGTEAGSTAAGVECPTGTCKPNAMGGRLGDYTTAPRAGASGSTSGGSGGGSSQQNGGTQ